MNQQKKTFREIEEEIISKIRLYAFIQQFATQKSAIFFMQYNMTETKKLLLKV